MTVQTAGERFAEVDQELDDCKSAIVNMRRTDNRRHKQIHEELVHLRREANVNFGLLCVVVGYQLIWTIGWVLGAW